MQLNQHRSNVVGGHGVVLNIKHLQLALDVLVVVVMLQMYVVVGGEPLFGEQDDVLGTVFCVVGIDVVVNC